MRIHSRLIVLVFIINMVALSFSIALAATSKDVSRQMRTAQSLFFKGKIQDANNALKKAEDMAAEIMAGSDAAEKSKVTRLEGRMKKIRKDIDKKSGKSTPTTGSTIHAAPVAVTQPSTSPEQSENLPSHVTSDLKVVEQYLDSTTKFLESRNIRNARRALGNAQNRLNQTAERKKQYFTPDHPEYIALNERINLLESAISAAEKKDADKKAEVEKASADAKIESDQWVARFKPYVTGVSNPGYDPERYFVASYTDEQPEMAKRAAIFGLVSTELEAYRKTGIGDNATEELQRIVREIEHAVHTFQSSSATMAVVKVENAERQIGYIAQWLDNEAKKIGSTEMPHTMNKMTFTSARRDLDAAASLLGEDDVHVQKLESRYQKAIDVDAKIAQARVAQTRMIPDKFDGPELNTLKTQSEKVVVNAKPGVKVLRTTVVTPDWREESVLEWTDTTRSVLRYRVTRAVSTQVAGEVGGQATLYTIHIAKDRQTSGSWGPLRGHIMFEDPILVENVQE